MERDSPYPLLLLFLSISPPLCARWAPSLFFPRFSRSLSFSLRLSFSAASAFPTDAVEEKYPRKRRSARPLPPRHPRGLLFGERAKRFSRSAEAAPRRNSARKVKSFLSSLAAADRGAGAAGGGAENRGRL